MAMLNNQRVYPVYDRFKRNNDDTPMSLKLEPSSEINAVHDSKNIAWLAGKKNRKWCANVFSPRSKPAAQDRLHPHRPRIQTAGIYLPFRGDDHGDGDDDDGGTCRFGWWSLVYHVRLCRVTHCCCTAASSRWVALWWTSMTNTLPGANLVQNKDGSVYKGICLGATRGKEHV